VSGPGTHPPGWVLCCGVPATPDPFWTTAPKGFLLSPHRSRVVFANDAGWADNERAEMPTPSIHRTRHDLWPPRTGQVGRSATAHLEGNTGLE
jgi:hypothetical protein